MEYNKYHISVFKIKKANDDPNKGYLNSIITIDVVRPNRDFNQIFREQKLFYSG